MTYASIKKDFIISNMNTLPLYIQISELLTREIAAGLYAQGDRLPPESELANTLDVAVGTLRKALSELESRGLLERRQGSGTYVKLSPMAHNTAQQAGVYGFFKLELLRGGGLPTASVIDFQKITTPESFQASFSRTCYRVHRLRSLGGLPVAIEEIYFDAKHNADLRIEDLGEALYQFYQAKLGFWISRVEDHIGIGNVPDWSPSLFSPSVGKPCPRVERVSWSGKNQIEEYSVTWFDPERCRYVNRMK
jgi:GntR family transcriptional regulator